VIDPNLVWSTYMDGTELEWDPSIAVDTTGAVYVTGGIYSTDWISGGGDTTFNGGESWLGTDAFIAKLSSSGEHLWSTYLGGSDMDAGNGIAVDTSGNVYVTGETVSSGWVSGGYDTTFNGAWDGFVAKLNSSGQVVWSTYLGGPEGDDGLSIALDATGAVYVTGDTSSSDWVSGGFDTTYNITPGSYSWTDGFIVKLTSSGAHLWSTYLGGTEDDEARSIVVDGEGAAYVTGMTGSPDWVSGGFDTSFGGGTDEPVDGFVVKVSVSGEHLWSTYLGGMDFDWGEAIAVDAMGAAYVTGQTMSSGWVSGGFDTSFNGGTDYSTDGFVVKLSSSGGHVWSTYLGGTEADEGTGIAVNAMGNLYVTGGTESSDWVSGGFDTSFTGGTDYPTDGFVVKLNSFGGHLWSSYLGGAEMDEGTGIVVNATGNLYVIGGTGSSDWVSGGFDTTYNADDYPGVHSCIFLAKITDDDPSVTLHDWNGDGIISIVGDVPPFVQCVYFGNCPDGVGTIAVGDCNADGILSIVGDVPCFVQCVYFNNCPE